MNQAQYKILIVEDDATIGEKIKSHLEKWAYKVTLASDFQDILGEVTTVSPDLILMDITLPYYNGCLLYTSPSPRD